MTIDHPGPTERELQEQMTSYVVQVVVEPDEDVWRAYVPELESRGAATWGQTRQEARRNIQEVAQMVIEELIEEQSPLPKSVIVSPDAVIAVTV
jgi:predicted RNase H-like HicB family nuclease